jgi:23S rRNA (pseudouridine1915-N3)-methyltransferase
MRVTLAHIGSQAKPRDHYDALIGNYLKQCTGVARCESEAFRSQKALFDWLDHQRGRTEPHVFLLDLTGRQMTSEQLAGWLRARRDEGAQRIVFAVGPADGWSEETRAEATRCGRLLSLGPMTLAHQLARLVMAEQLYRACTILTGHPYHRG